MPLKIEPIKGETNDVLLLEIVRVLNIFIQERNDTLEASLKNPGA